jgi:hypothetical protein
MRNDRELSSIRSHKLKQPGDRVTIKRRSSDNRATIDRRAQINDQSASLSRASGRARVSEAIGERAIKSTNRRAVCRAWSGVLIEEMRMIERERSRQTNERAIDRRTSKQATIGPRVRARKRSMKRGEGCARVGFSFSAGGPPSLSFPNSKPLHSMRYRYRLKFSTKSDLLRLIPQNP